MTCKDCIHYDVCSKLCTGIDMNLFMKDDNTTASESCTDFKDKSKIIDLPCKVGDKLYDISELLMPQCYSPEMYIFNADDICISKDNRDFIFTIDGNDYRYEDFGKSVFFSNEEAFAKLKE